MNKKVNEEFKGIKDVYVLQCICTELKELCNKYEEEHNTTFKEWQKDIQANRKAKEYIENYNVFKEFTFPLMKKWEENQVKSSIDYQFKNDLKKNLINILEGNNEYNK